MRITRLQLRDFESYHEADIDLSGVRTLVVVGHNMHGKSALLDAVTWVLYDRHRYGGSPDKLVRDGTGIARAAVEFTDGEGRKVRVQREKPRGRTGTLALFVDGSEYKAPTIAETEERVRQIVGLSFDAFVSSSFMVQAGQYKNVVGIAAAGAAARADIVIEVYLDAAFWQRVFELAKDLGMAEAAKAGVLGVQRDRLAAAAEGLDGARAEAERLRAGHAEAEAVATAARDRARDAAAAVERMADVSRRRGEAAARAADLHGRVSASDEALRRIAEQERQAAAAVPVKPPDEKPPKAPGAKAIAALKARADAAQGAAAEAGPLRLSVAAMRRDVEAVDAWHATREGVPCGGKGKYAACQFLRPPAGHDRLDELRAELATGDSRLAELDGAGDAGELIRQLDRDREAAVAAERTVERRRSGMAVWQAAQDAADANLAGLAEQRRIVGEQRARDEADAAAAAAERDRLGAEAEQLLEAERAKGAAEEAQRAADASVAALAGPLRAAEADLVAAERAASELGTVQAALDEAAAETDVLRLLANAFHRKGIPTLLIESGIPALEAQANAVLAGLPDAMTLRLVTQRTTKAGTASDTLDIVVAWKGRERDYDGLSIGGRFRVELALRIALGRVLAHGAGRAVETLWLDEPLANVDEEGRAAVVETLLAVADQFGLVVVVTHDADVRDAFEAVLEVTQDGDGVSRAVLR